MKPKTLILMVVAISCGLGASYMTSRLLADRQQEVEKVSILIAKKTLSTGETLKIPEDLFTLKQFPSGEEPKLAIADPKVLQGRVLKRSLRQGDFITPDDLLDDKNPGMMYELPQGQQAIGIRVSPETIAGGFASLPHSRVNIISTVRRGDDVKSYSKILLENVLVLAADGTTKIVENGQAMPANVVTVALKPEDVLKLELAKTMGTISLALRKYNDNSKSEITSVTVEGMRGNNVAEDPTTEQVPTQAPAAIPLAAKEPQPKVPGTAPVVANDPTFSQHTLTVFNGPNVTQTIYKTEELPQPASKKKGN
ncbi:MAG: Flp pilus assembly protein CpaB [Gemmataceae bacterium]|nr:Flp pilus assembly protein CpaB [Gemmataceae bacterium]